MQEFSRKQRYLLLAVLFAITVSFQTAISSQQFSAWMHLPDPAGALRGGTWPIIFLLQILNPFLCLAFGFYVALVRGEDRRAWLLLAVLISFGVAMDGIDVHDSVMRWPAPINHFALVYRTLNSRGWGICLLVFSIYFPDRAAFDKRRPALKWILLVPCLGALAIVALETIGRNERGAWETVAAKLQGVYAYVAPFLVWAPILSFCLILLVKFRQATNADSRRRLRLLTTGLAFSVIPPLAFGTLIHFILHTREDAFGSWVVFVAYSPLALLPLVLAYVTIVEKALDVRVVVRQGLRYALAKRGLVLVQLLVSAVVIFAVAIESDRESFTARLLVTAIGISLLLSISLGGRRLAHLIDRKFFRDAYRAEQILARLAENVRNIRELPLLLETVRAQTSEAMHVNDLEIFLRDRERFQPALAYDAPAWNHAASTVVLERERRPLRIETDRWLIPLLGRTELLGFLTWDRALPKRPIPPAMLN